MFRCSDAVDRPWTAEVPVRNADAYESLRVGQHWIHNWPECTYDRSIGPLNARREIQYNSSVVDSDLPERAKSFLWEMLSPFFTLSNPSTIITTGMGIRAIASRKNVSSSIRSGDPVFGETMLFSSEQKRNRFILVNLQKRVSVSTDPSICLVLAINLSPSRDWHCYEIHRQENSRRTGICLSDAPAKAQKCGESEQSRAVLLQCTMLIWPVASFSRHPTVLSVPWLAFACLPKVSVLGKYDKLHLESRLCFYFQLTIMQW